MRNDVPEVWPNTYAEMSKNITKLIFKSLFIVYW